MPAARILSSDLARLDDEVSRRLRAAGVEVLHDDAATLVSVPDGLVDAIVTDPAWGEHDDETDVVALWRGFARAARRVLAPGGRVAVLIARRRADELASALEDAGFEVGQRHALLVHGHPATLVVARSG